MGTEHDAVKHLLTEPRIAARTAPYITNHGFDFGGLAAAAGSFSGGERLLVRIATELWTAERHAGLWELVRRLDGSNFDRVVEALWIARGAYATGAERKVAA